MNLLKFALFAEIRNKNEEYKSLNDDELNQLVFHHKDGLRLSLTGFMIIKKIFTAYSFSMPATIKSKHLFGLSKMEYPYFVTRRRLVLFSDMDAMVIKLAGGIEQFLETCSQIE
jgi:dGTP triphosphohydrolase